MTKYHSSITWLDFKPLPGLSSKHLQTILPVFRSVKRTTSLTSWFVNLNNNDCLSCEIAQPEHWNPSDSTVILVHGLGGSHNSNYMVRMTNGIVNQGSQVINANLRGCGSGKGLSKLPYHAGCSSDLLKVIERCKSEFPSSKITVIGFSLGANVILKLAGELGANANQWIEKCVAVCPPLDLKQTVLAISKKRHYIYHRYYLKSLFKQHRHLVKDTIKSLYEFDQLVTAPLSGFKDAEDYYSKCSCKGFIPQIQCPTDLLCTADDPFIDLTALNGITVPPSVKVWATAKGGHMGFLGCNAKEHNSYWMDKQLLQWIGN